MDIRSKIIKLEDGSSIEFYPSLSCSELEWPEPQGISIFLSRHYLFQLELLLPTEMKPLYAVFRDGKEVKAQFYFQKISFKGKERLKIEDPIGCPGLLNNLKIYFKKVLAQRVDFDVLICGNLLATGNYGMYIHPGTDVCSVLNRILPILKKEIIFHGFEYQIVLLKEYSPVETRDISQHCGQHNQLYPFVMQPGMHLYLHESWKQFNDYVNALQSKYRVRLNKAKLKCAQLKWHICDADDIKKHEEIIFSLYEKVVHSSGFNLVVLKRDYFEQLKRALKDDFTLVLIFNGDKPIAFYSYIVNNTELEAHYLGFEKQDNASFHLYLNILFRLIENGIQHQVESVNFARTALEIKSSVGAVEEELTCYVSHCNPIYNHFIPQLLEYFKPTEEWVPRRPFK